MAKSLVQWFIYSLVVGIFAAYTSSWAIEAGAQYLTVFRFAGTTAFVGYALGCRKTQSGTISHGLQL
ncbi:MAG: hypothetical protein O6939_06900 [Bacteroidetes bacterium]|nr:hypothetical protein [Bacteroidota bacterium]